MTRPTRATNAPTPVPRRVVHAAAVPFASAEEAWFWTMAALVARRDGARIVAGRGLVARPCEPDDVVRSLDRLYRQRRVDVAHARVLRLWGERGVPPDPRAAGEAGDARLWTEALDRLEWPLRIKGIVAERRDEGARHRAAPVGAERDEERGGGERGGEERGGTAP